jgi:hypothetical protein
MTKKSPEEILDALEEQRLDDAMDRVLSRTHEERLASLRDKNVDFEAAKAELDAWLEESKKPAPVIPLAPRRGGSLRVVVFYAAAAVAGLALAGGGTVVAMRYLSAPEETPRSLPAKPPPSAEAAQLRRQAFARCREHQWGACLYGLDQARQLDPDGDTDPRVQEYRRQAEAGMQKR